MARTTQTARKNVPPAPRQGPSTKNIVRGKGATASNHKSSLAIGQKLKGGAHGGF